MGSDMKIREELYIKMSNDYNSYIENLKKSSIDNILNSAYEKTMKENILNEFTPEFKHYDIEKIKALNTYENPLDKLYKERFKSDIGIHTLFEDSIYDTLSDIVKEQKEKKKSRER